MSPVQQRSSGSVAGLVRQHKDKHPELYCPSKGCLWRLDGRECPKHEPARKQEKE